MSVLLNTSDTASFSVNYLTNLDIHQDTSLTYRQKVIKHAVLISTKEYNENGAIGYGYTHLNIRVTPNQQKRDATYL